MGRRTPLEVRSLGLRVAPGPSEPSLLGLVGELERRVAALTEEMRFRDARLRELVGRPDIAGTFIAERLSATGAAFVAGAADAAKVAADVRRAVLEAESDDAARMAARFRLHRFCASLVLRDQESRRTEHGLKVSAEKSSRLAEIEGARIAWDQLLIRVRDRLLPVFY